MLWSHAEVAPWSNPTAPPPATVDGQLAQQSGYYGILLGFLLGVDRAKLERLTGGNPSWNVGVGSARVPVVTVHTTGDGLTPPAQQRQYADEVIRHGDPDRIRQLLAQIGAGPTLLCDRSHPVGRRCLITEIQVPSCIDRSILTAYIEGVTNSGIEM